MRIELGFVSSFFSFNILIFSPFFNYYPSKNQRPAAIGPEGRWQRVKKDNSIRVDALQLLEHPAQNGW
jgi:hypothetical protein